MSGVRNSFETVNAAATAIVTAESRVQPAAVQKKRWSSFWSIYWCFGSYKQSKRIGHAVLVSEPPPTGTVPPIPETRNRSSTIVMPFIAPPSSPASFLQSDPPSATQSPAGFLSLSVHVQSSGGTAPIFTIGPYAHETQLVSPPVFSTFTTEPSTASFTPPPELVQITTPSSPEVPFAQLLSSSLARSKRNSEFRPYHYPGSPGSQVKSPGSVISTSGTSSPFPDKRPEAPKFLGYEHFPNYKWYSRVGSGSLTPNDGISRLGSGALTPNGGEPSSRDNNLPENQISVDKRENDDAVFGQRVSFELFGEEIPSCTVSAPVIHTLRNPQEAIAEDINEDAFTSKNLDHFNEENGNEVHGMPLNHTISLGSSKDFNFNNAKGEVIKKSSIECEWWTNEKTELSPQNRWSFFPMLRSEAS